jgi:hypothetical protein
MHATLHVTFILFRYVQCLILLLIQAADAVVYANLDSSALQLTADQECSIRGASATEVPDCVLQRMM